MSAIGEARASDRAASAAWKSYDLETDPIKRAELRKKAEQRDRDSDSDWSLAAQEARMDEAYDRGGDDE